MKYIATIFEHNFYTYFFRKCYEEVDLKKVIIIFLNLQSWKKWMAKRQKTALCLTPQAMYNQFKRPSAGSVSELYYICRKT